MDPYSLVLALVPSGYLKDVLAGIGACAIITMVFPPPKAPLWLAKAWSVLNVIACNMLHAKNAGG